jgi:predicted RNase H-related nuclease YkuK (DUF458 family)
MWRLYFYFIKYKTIILDRLRHLLIIAFLAGYQQILFAQKDNSITVLNEIDKNLNETIFVSTNTNSFLTGETLFYKIFCVDRLTNMPTKYTKVAYLELINSNKEIVFTHKLFLENGTANSEFFIPTTLETGIYKIVGYTKWMQNKDPEVYFNTDIYIVNPYKEKPITAVDPVTDEKPMIESNVTDDNILFEIKNKTFTNREQIELKINTDSDDFRNGNYMISIRKTDTFLSKNKILFSEYQKANRSTVSNNEIVSPDFSFPELRGEIISGRITSINEEIKNKKIALSIVGKNYDLKLARTDEQGKFIFNLEKSNPNSNVVVQILDNNKESYTIELDKPKEVDFSKLAFSNLQFNSESDKNITERLISSQVENAYYNIKKDSLVNPSNSLPFFRSSKEYKLDDFTRFTTMEETITEVVSGVVYRKDNKNYSLHVYDYDENYESALSPLILVDGLILEDLNEFFASSPKNIYKVNVVKGLYYYGSKSFNGLIAFTTKNGNYETALKESFIIKPYFLRPQSKKEYFQPDYLNNKNLRTPDYRHQLLWVPNVDLNKANSKFTFYTSDVSGLFEVLLEGFSASGKPVYIKKIIEVKDSDVN